MAEKRKPLSSSLRWSVFARDGFTCRYCGVRAGEEGVELACDHVISVAEGGTNTYDNLVTACKKCNGGKGARSLKEAPTTSDVIGRLDDRAKMFMDQARAMSEVIRSEKAAQQEAVNLKCHAYGVHSVQISPKEKNRIVGWCREFGADRVLDWYRIAAGKNVVEAESIRYVSAIARNVREEESAHA